MSTYEKYEDATLRKVFQVTLDPAQGSAPVVYLGQLAQVITGSDRRCSLPPGLYCSCQRGQWCKL